MKVFQLVVVAWLLTGCFAEPIPDTPREWDVSEERVSYYGVYIGQEIERFREKHKDIEIVSCESDPDKFLEVQRIGRGADYSGSSEKCSGFMVAGIPATNNEPSVLFIFSEGSVSGLTMTLAGRTELVQGELAKINSRIGDARVTKMSRSYMLDWENYGAVIINGFYEPSGIPGMSKLTIFMGLKQSSLEVD